MTSRPWYKRYPRDFITGTLSLTLEEKGAYSIVLDLIYDRGGPIPDDAGWVARACGCSVRKWTSIRSVLIASGKLILTEDGDLSNRRAQKEVAESGRSGQVLRENAAKSGRKSVENRPKTARKSSENEVKSFENNELGEKKSPYVRESRSQRQNQITPSDPLGLDDLSRVVAAVWDAAGMDPTAKRDGGYTRDFANAREWLRSGMQADDLIATANKVLAGRSDIADPFAYLAKLLPEALSAVRVDMPNCSATGEGGGDPWELRVAEYARSGVWLDSWGPPPDRPGCRVAAEILTEHGFVYQGKGAENGKAVRYH